jgi:tetratricopeptide (TPR) repeat protein
LHADLLEFDAADRIYQRALREYQDISPFAVAWVCFQLGVLWGELVSKPQSGRAAHWYRKAIEYLPRYVKARVHLSEIYLRSGSVADAEFLLASVASSGDPEVAWRLAHVMVAAGRFKDAEANMQAARSAFEALLEKSLFAFADHGAEFYSAGGNDPRRAFELASVNLANRPTLRAFELAYATAVGAGVFNVATETLAAAKERWGALPFFCLSPLAACGTDFVNNDAQSVDNSVKAEFEHSLKRSMF